MYVRVGGHSLGDPGYPVAALQQLLCQCGKRLHMAGKRRSNDSEMGRKGILKLKRKTPETALHPGFRHQNCLQPNNHPHKKLSI